jgi:hypothetical protein
MVSASIRDREDEVRFHDRLTEDQFNALPYEEITFRERMIGKKRAEDVREKMLVVSFGAWQQLRYKGLKMGWPKYVKALELDPRQKRTIDKDEKVDLYKKALDIHERLKKGRKK